MRLIDADRLIKGFCAHCTSMGEDGVCEEGGDCFDIKLIKHTPTVEAEPVKRGQWINHGSFVTCSVCNEEQYGIDTGRFYCQNCGAKMEVEDGD